MIFEWGFIVGEVLCLYFFCWKGCEKGFDVFISCFYNDSDMGDVYDVVICCFWKGVLCKFVEFVLFNGKYIFEMDFLRGLVFDIRVEDIFIFLVLLFVFFDLF